MDNLALIVGYALIMLFTACLIYFVVASMIKFLRKKVYYPIRDCIRYRTPSVVSCRCHDCLYSEKMDNSTWLVDCTRYCRVMPAKRFCSYACRVKRGEKYLQVIELIEDYAQS